MLRISEVYSEAIESDRVVLLVSPGATHLARTGPSLSAPREVAAAVIHVLRKRQLT